MKLQTIPKPSLGNCLYDHCGAALGPSTGRALICTMAWPSASVPSTPPLPRATTLQRSQKIYLCPCGKATRGFTTMPLCLDCSNL